MVTPYEVAFTNLAATEYYNFEQEAAQESARQDLKKPASDRLALVDSMLDGLPRSDPFRGGNTLAGMLSPIYTRSNGDMRLYYVQELPPNNHVILITHIFRILAGSPSPYSVFYHLAMSGALPKVLTVLGMQVPEQVYLEGGQLRLQ